MLRYIALTYCDRLVEAQCDVDMNMIGSRREEATQWNVTAGSGKDVCLKVPGLSSIP